MNKLNSVWHNRKVHRTTLLAIYCSGILCGLGLANIGWRVTGLLCFLLSVGLFVAVFTRKRWVAIPAIVLAGLLFGIWRGGTVHTDLKTYQAYVGQKVQITGVVVDDASYGDKGQRDMRLEQVRLDGHGPPGTVRVTAFTLLQPRRGDIVQVSGKLYDGFGNYQAAIYFGDLTVVHTNQSFIDDARHNFAAVVYSNLPDTQASLGLGVLLGIKTQLPDDMSDQLKALSLTHIVVASGYNLTVLIRLARRLFEKRSKFQTAAMGSLLMLGFVLMTGFSASMSRAVLVAGLSLAAWYYGRRIHPVVLLLFAAAVTATINPIYVWSDLGWWLSFLSFAGVLLLAPLLQRRLFGKKQPKLAGQIILETCAAQIMTVPLSLAIFGTFSVLGLLANVLIVPLVPLGMLLTFAAGAAGSFMGASAAYIALPAVWLLTYITQTVSLLAAVPWASINIKIGPVIMIGLYLLLLGGGFMLWRVTRHNFLSKSVIE
jgi:competence protein ComEC